MTTSDANYFRNMIRASAPTTFREQLREKYAAGEKAKISNREALREFCKRANEEEKKKEEKLRLEAQQKFRNKCLEGDT